MATDSECTSCEDAFTIIYDYCEVELVYLSNL